MVFSCPVVVCTKKEHERLGSEGYAPLNMAQIKELRAFFVNNVPGTAAIEVIAHSILSGGIQVQSASGKEPSPILQSIISGSWVSFARLCIGSLMSYGLCLCSISADGEPNVVPLDLVLVEVRTDSATAQRDYRVVINPEETQVQAQQSVGQGRAPGPRASSLGQSLDRDSRRAKDLLDGAVMYLFEENPPTPKGELTCPMRAVIPLESFARQTLRNAAMSGMRRAAPPLIVQENGKQVDPDPNADRDFDAAGDRGRADVQGQQADDDFKAARLAEALKRSQALSRGSAVSSQTVQPMLDPAKAVLLDTATNKATGSRAFPAGDFSSGSYVCPVILLPKGYTAASVPAAVSEEPSRLFEPLACIVQAVSQITGVPSGLIGGSEHATTDSANQLMVNFFAISLQRWRQIVVHILKITMTRAFGELLEEEDDEEPIEIMKFVRPPAEGETDSGYTEGNEAGESTLPHQAGSAGRTSSSSSSSSSAEREGAKKDKPKAGSRPGRPSNKKSDGGVADEDDDKLVVAETIGGSEEQKKGIEQVVVRLPVTIDPAISWEFYENGVWGWEEYIKHAPVGYYGIDPELLAKKRLDPISGRPLEEVEEEKHDEELEHQEEEMQLKRDALEAKSAPGGNNSGSGSSTGGGGGGGASKSSASKQKGKEGTSPSKTPSVLKKRRGADSQQSAMDAKKRKTVNNRTSKAAH